MLGSLNFIKSVFTTFGMTYKLDLSTRPKKALGEKEIWNRAESALARAMDNFAAEGGWKVNPGDGAFYVMDAMERIHQCATIQLDFQLPIRFNLQ
jgi:threonyl-tRNA synthetase